MTAVVYPLALLMRSAALAGWALCLPLPAAMRAAGL